MTARLTVKQKRHRKYLIYNAFNSYFVARRGIEPLFPE